MSGRYWGLLTAGLFALSLTGCARHAAQPPAPSESLSFRGAYEVYPSGLQLLAYETPNDPQVKLGVSYLAGAAEEPAGKEGLALLAAHLTYVARHGGPQAPRLDSQLASGGAFLHPSITHDDTTYELSAPAEHLPRMMALEAQRMRDPLAGVTEEVFVSTRAMLARMQQQEIERLPALEEVHRVFAAFLGDHPYGHSVGGTPESLQRITLDDVRAFVKAHYTPDRAVVVVTGPRSLADIKFELARGFMGLTGTGSTTRTPPVRQQLAPLPPPEVGSVESVKAVTSGPVDAPKLWMMWALPGLQAGKRMQSSQLEILLESAINAAFAADKRVQGSWVHAWERNGVTFLTARIGLSRREDAEGVAQAVLRLSDRAQHIAWSATMSPDSRETLIESNRLQLYSWLESRPSADMARVLRATGSPQYMSLWEQNTVTGVEDLGAYCREYLRPERARAMLVIPDERGAVSSRASSVAAQLGAVSALNAFVLPEPSPEPGQVPLPPGLPSLGEIERFQLPNGLTVVAVRRGSAPLVDIRMLARIEDGGTGPDSARSARQLATHLWEGAASLSGRKFTVTSGPYVSLRSLVLSPQLSGRLEHLRTTLELPTWKDEASFNRFRDRVADRDKGAAARLKALQWEQMQAWRDARLHPGNVTLLLVGALPPGPELRGEVEEALGSWKAHRGGDFPQQASAPDRARPARGKRSIAVWNAPGQDNALMMLSLEEPAPDAGQDVVADVLAVLLEEQLKLAPWDGPVAHVHATTVRTKGHHRSLNLYSGFEKARAAEVLDRSLLVLKTLRSTPLSPDMVELSRWKAARRRAAHFLSTSQVAEQLERLTWDGRTLENAMQDSRRIAEVTAEQLQALLGQHSLGEEQVMFLGDEATLKPLLEKAGYAIP